MGVLGNRLIRQNKIDEAIVVFEQIRMEYPRSSGAFESLGNVYLKKGKTESAIINFKQSLKLNPNNVTVKLILQSLQK